MVATIGAVLRTGRQAFAQGFAAMLPFWIGAIPVGVAYSIAARHAGLNAWEAQLMSLLAFTAAGQIAAVSAFEDGASLLLIVLTTIALNVQLLMLGLAAGRRFRPGRTGKLLSAWLLTDGAFAVAFSLSPPTLAGLCGAGASMYLAWNLGTGIGLLSGDLLLGIGKATAGLIAPLMFVAVLAPVVRQRASVIAVIVAGISALVVSFVAPAGVCVLAGGCAGGIAGLATHRKEQMR
jgi:predicted branched-subunit amino acid permease